MPGRAEGAGMTKHEIRMSNRADTSLNVISLGCSVSLALLLMFGTGCTSEPSSPAITPETPVAPRVTPAAMPPEKPAVDPPQPMVPAEGPALAPPPLVQPAGPVENGEFGQVGPPIPISFDDIVLDLKPDIVFFRSMLTPRAKELEGKLVSLRGYFDNEIYVKDGIKQFVLLRNTECKFGPGYAADHVIAVELVPGGTAKYVSRPITVTGLLTVKPYTGFDGNSWAVYHILARKVE